MKRKTRGFGLVDCSRQVGHCPPKPRKPGTEPRDLPRPFSDPHGPGPTPDDRTSPSSPKNRTATHSIDTTYKNLPPLLQGQCYSCGDEEDAAALTACPDSLFRWSCRRLQIYWSWLKLVGFRADSRFPGNRGAPPRKHPSRSRDNSSRPGTTIPSHGQTLIARFADPPRKRLWSIRSSSESPRLDPDGRQWRRAASAEITSRRRGVDGHERSFPSGKREVIFRAPFG